MRSASQDLALKKLRSQLVSLERGRAGSIDRGLLSFGVPGIDGRLPAGGLLTGALHEFESGADPLDDGASALLIAGLLAQTHGTVLWVMPKRNLFAPALAAVGLHPSRLIYAEAGKDVLLIVEEALRHRGLAGVVGELSGRMTMTTSRRLQLATEGSGALTCMLRREHHKSTAQTKLNDTTVALTRWRVASMPSPPPIPDAPGAPGLARARWRLDLIRCRGGEPFSWMVEACDAQGRLALVSDAVDRSIASCHIRHAA
jgi:protein ImuA